MTTADPDPIDHRDDCPAPHVGQQRGNQGDRLLRCHGCKRFVVLEEDAEATAPEPAPAPRTGARYELTCTDCGRDMPLSSSRPRVPLCRGCSGKRPRRRRDRRAGRRREVEREWLPSQ